ncbi:B-cell linker protein [Nematolebias whitei]|uniref:B-cell linker protein n=1 Tax=Nematolebias whitei TaxID=451745 RepID=UPI001897BE76|nr:B-cell linker protein [Nematolebias whitei]
MNLPTRQECEGWDQNQVALFMCKNKMQDCAVTVTRLKINGHRLLNLTENDISKFSLVHQPQLQKIVQDIRKNDGSLLDRLRRLKTKTRPAVPVRDYRDNRREHDHSSDSEYDNETYEDPHDDDSYEPPPSHKEFITTQFLPRGEYLDSCRERPSRPPKKPPISCKASKQLPPEPPCVELDEDYVDPDGAADDDYVEPSENPPPKLKLHAGTRTGLDRPRLSSHLPERAPSPDFYEVPDKEVQESSCEDEYEVCDPDDRSGDKPAAGPARRPKPLTKERSPKPPLVPKPDLKPRAFESKLTSTSCFPVFHIKAQAKFRMCVSEGRSLPVVQTEPKPPPKAASLDLKRQKFSLLQFTLPKAADRGAAADAGSTGSTSQDQDADVGNKPWFAAACDRRTADDALLRSNKDGAFLVRNSSGQDAQQPYTLVVLYNSRVYNIPIRFISATQQYALGRAKRGEEYFSSVSHIIDNHQKTPLVLIDIQSNSKDATKLCHPVKP